LTTKRDRKYAALSIVAAFVQPNGFLGNHDSRGAFDGERSHHPTNACEIIGKAIKLDLRLMPSAGEHDRPGQSAH
jgi:hypothetical protein